MAGPDSTATRVALWRAQHVLLDARPYVLEDLIGLQLVAPPEGWQQRPDMNPQWTSSFRAHIVGRARYVEDLVTQLAATGVRQYVILGAGVDTFVQRRPDLASSLRVFEIDQPDTQAWKRERLEALGLGIPSWLTLVPVNFETQGSWREALVSSGFDATQPAVVVSTGVTQYLTRPANAELFKEVSRLAPGSTLAITFMLPIAMLPKEEQAGTQAATDGAKRSGTPFISFYSPEEFMALARQCGFREVRHVSTEEVVARYFAGRSDGLLPAHGEQLIVAKR
ncbi:MAG: class I SAM-dependent methyltransferase [Archangiaceae bacterium]|nr:class I SAM-dependent methyltransferase [Archangiaceae bacterium]